MRGRGDAIRTANDGEQLRRAMNAFRLSQKMLSEFLIVDVDEDAANLFDRLRTHKKTKSMSRADMLIACIALAQKLCL
jgi:predicted nucleic acid-binding protein